MALIRKASLAAGIALSLVAPAFAQEWQLSEPGAITTYSHNGDVYGSDHGSSVILHLDDNGVGYGSIDGDPVECVPTYNGTRCR
jgi:hypothetical protein